MKPFLRLIVTLLILFSVAGEASATPPAVERQAPPEPAASTSDWPQVQNNAQHTGLYSGTLGTNFAVAWRHAFQPEKVYPQVQAIVSGGAVFAGTEMGNLYAFNATTGAQLWKFSVGSPILASVAVSNGRVFFGAMDGAVYALDASSGAQVWKTQLSTFTGFSTAPVLADNKLLIGGRNGIFYALDFSGAVVWQYKAGGPILMTAAADNGLVFFTAMDMRVYALNTSTGAQQWVTGAVNGLAFKDYWPVVYGGMVYVRTLTPYYLGLAGTDYANSTSASAQQALLADYDAHPQNYKLSLYRFNESTGAQGSAVIAYNFNTINGTTPPPCVDRDGRLIVPAMYPRRFYVSGWGRLNVSTRMIDDFLMQSDDAGTGNQDETLLTTCTQNLVLVFHNQEENANYTGAFNLDTRTWTRISAGETNRQMSNNTQGGGGNPASVANGMIYHIAFYELIARTTN